MCEAPRVELDFRPILLLLDSCSFLSLNLKVDLRERLDEWGNMFTFSPGKSWRNKVEIQGLMSKKHFGEKGLDLENYSDQSLLLGLFPVCLVHQVCPVWKEKGYVICYLKYSIQSWWRVCKHWIHVGLTEFSVNALKSIWWMENFAFQIFCKKLDSQVDHSVHWGLGSQGLQVALGVLVLQAHPAERPWVTTCHAGMDISILVMLDTTSSQYTAKKRRGGRSEMRVSWAARQAVLIHDHGDSLFMINWALLSSVSERSCRTWLTTRNRWKTTSISGRSVIRTRGPSKCSFSKLLCSCLFLWFIQTDGSSWPVKLSNTT